LARTSGATGCQRIFIVMRHGARAFVETLDFVTSLGHGATGRERRALGVRTEGPVLIVTDLCIMRPEPGTNEFEVVSLHPGVSRARVSENTGWPVRFANQVEETRDPSEHELGTLRDLNDRTARAHGAAAAE
jgi:glutaconate CoA-transferase subunit B